MSNGIKAWSWSRFADYQQCPAKAKYKHVQRIKEPGSAAMARGAKLHDVLAAFLTSKTERLPELLEYEFDFKPFSEKFPDMGFMMSELNQLRKRYQKKNSGIVVEDDWAFTRAWETTLWNDWAGCWVRMKLDLAHTTARGKVLIITDWKSGRARAEEESAYAKQLELYAVAGFLKFPKVDLIFPRLAFVDAGKVFPEDPKSLSFERENLERMKKDWAKLVSPLFLDEIFAPRPTQKCRWCWYGQAKKAENGPGVCEF